MKLVLQINWVWIIIYFVPTFIQPIVSRFFRSPMFLSDYMVPFRFTWLVSFPPHPGRYCEYKDTFSDSFQYFLNPFIKIPFAIVYYRISERVVSSQVVQDSLDQKHYNHASCSYSFSHAHVSFLLLFDFTLINFVYQY